MNCTEIQELAAALIDDESLTDAESREIEYHLDACRECRYEFDMDKLMARIVRNRIGLVDTPRETYRSVMHVLALG